MKKILSTFFVMLIFSAMFLGCENEVEEYQRLPNLIFSINGIDSPEKSDPSWFDVQKSGNETNDEISINLILDAGLGMKGFIANRDSNYLRMVSSLNSVCANVYNNYSFSSYKLLNEIYMLRDEENKWIPLESNYTNVMMENFFYAAKTGTDWSEWDKINDGAPNNRNTEYMKIIDKIEEIDNSFFDSNRQSKSGNVFIIVSDFIPDKKDNTSFDMFANELYARVLSNGVGCGIVGIQSTFDGTVNGIHKDDRYMDIDYKGEMPFYFMVIGEIEEVEKIINQIQVKASQYKISEQDIKSLLIDTRYPYSTGVNSKFINSWLNRDELSSYELQNIINEKLVSLELTPNMLFENTAANNFSKKQQNTAGASALQGVASCSLDINEYERSNLEIEKWEISYEVKVAQGEERYPYKNLLVFTEDDPEAFVPQDISMEKYDYVYSQAVNQTKKLNSIDEKNKIWQDRTNVYDKSKKVTFSENADEIVKINKAYVKDNTLYIEYSINPEKMLDDMPYFVEIKVEAEPSICLCELDEWTENWTMSLGCIDEWQEDEETFEGGCTPYFAQAIEGLRGENIVEEPFVRTYCFLISKSQLLTADED